MPNSSLTPQENINEINRLLGLIAGRAAKHPARGKDIAILDLVKQIQTESLYNLQKKIGTKTNSKTR